VARGPTGRPVNPPAEARTVALLFHCSRLCRAPLLSQEELLGMSAACQRRQASEGLARARFCSRQGFSLPCIEESDLWQYRPSRGGRNKFRILPEAGHLPPSQGPLLQILKVFWVSKISINSAKVHSPILEERPRSDRKAFGSATLATRWGGQRPPHAGSASNGLLDLVGAVTRFALR
jgi:hypothetical protein